MKRLAVLLPVLLLATVVVASAPAGATDACAGTGVFTTGTPLRYPIATTPSPGLWQPPWSTWLFGPTVGTCAPSLAKNLSATGIMNGWCGLNSGTGTTANGYRFAWVNVGTVMVLTGGLAGVASIVPDVVNGESCLTGADSFLVTYGVVKVGCGLTKTKQLVDIPIPPHLLTVAGVAVHSDGNHVWLKLCVGVK